MQQPSQKKPKKEIVISLIKESGNYYGKFNDVWDEGGKRKKSNNPPTQEIKKFGIHYGKDQEGRDFYRHRDGRWYSINTEGIVERIK